MMYDAYMNKCGELIRRRYDLGRAASLATNAAAIASTPRLKAAALQQCGIANRLLGEPEYAINIFTDAISLLVKLLHKQADDDQAVVRRTLAGCYRDRAMAYLESSWPSDNAKAPDDVDESLGLLDEQLDRVDWLNTVGFRGRVKLLGGQPDAEQDLKVAFWGLHDLTEEDHPSIRTFELNALVWLLKVSHPLPRLCYVPMAARLLVHERNKQRAAEVAVLLSGGMPLHRRLMPLVKKRL